MLYSYSAIPIAIIPVAHKIGTMVILQILSDVSNIIVCGFFLAWMINDAIRTYKK
jgi:hypothetical protein